MHKTGISVSALHLLARARRIIGCVYSSIIGSCV